MSLTGTVYRVSRSSQDGGRDTWRITVTAPGHKDLAVEMARTGDACPLLIGEPVTVPEFHGGHVTAHRNPDVRVPFLGFAFDPDAPLH